MKWGTWLMFATLGIAAGCSAESGTLIKEPWQTSWPKFLEQIGDYRNKHPDNQIGLMGPVGEQHPDSLEKTELVVGSMLMGSGGPACPKHSWGKRFFEREVEFQGVFKGTKPTSEQIKKDRAELETVDLEMRDTSPPVFLYVYPAAAALTKWHDTKSETTVRFTAKVGGIVVTEVKGQAYIISLCEAAIR